MNRSELIKRISKQHPHLTAKDVELAVRSVLDAVSTTLANGGKVKVRSFGRFDAALRPPRIGRNPQTGEAVHIPAKRVMHFKPSAELRDRVNKRK